METNLMIVFTQGKIFVGKTTKLMDGSLLTTLEDCIECIPLMTPDGRYMIIGNLIGTLTIPKDCVIAEVSKDSMYYKNYYQTTTNVEVVNPGQNLGPRRIH